MARLLALRFLSFAATLLLSLGSIGSWPGRSSAAWPSLIDLASTPSQITAYGGAPYDHSGWEFTSGDYDGDDIVDWVVLSRGRGGDTGYLFFHIFWGDTPAAGQIDLANPAAHVSVVRTMEGETGPYSSMTSGDYDGDGYDDIALGSPCPFGGCPEKVYIVFGEPSFPDSVDLTAPNVRVTTIYGIENVDGLLGMMMATGDVNGDQIDDLVVSAPEGFYFDWAQIYVITGRAAMPEALHLSERPPGVTYLLEPRPYVNTGTSISVGDVNGDGFDDVLVGGPDGEDLLLVDGGATLPDTIILAPPHVRRFYGAAVGWRTVLTDFNGDGYADIVGSVFWDPEPIGCQDCGGVVIIPGGNNLPQSLELRSQSAGIIRLMGTGDGQWFGIQLAGGDVNGDGLGDLLVVSGPDLSDGEDVGKVTIVFGSTAPPNRIWLGTDSTLARILAEERPGAFGQAIYAVDLNLDGADEVFIGSPTATAQGRVYAGKAYVLNGGTVSSSGSGIPRHSPLVGQNYPNPFNPATTIPVHMDRSGSVRITIVTVRGVVVKEMRYEHLGTGDHRIAWDGRGESGSPLPSGVYFCRVRTPNGVESRRMTLLR